MNRVPHSSFLNFARPRRDRIFSDRRICDHHTRSYWTDYERCFRESDVTADAIILVVPHGYEDQYDTRNPPIEFFFTEPYHASNPAIVNATEGDAYTYQPLEILLRRYVSKYVDTPKPSDERITRDAG